MKKLLCFIGALFAVLAVNAQKVESARSTQPKTFKKTMQRVGEAVDTVDYYTVAQSTTSNYQFAPNGGDITTYNVGIARDGNQVTFKNFFSLYNPADYTPTIESDFTGIYDEASKTITVPTSSIFANATVVCSIYNYYIGTLICGQIDNTGTLYPDEQLVFHVEGDFEKLTTDQAVAVAYYPPTGGQAYGLYKSYRRIVLCIPKETGELISFNESVDLGSTFPNVAAVKDSIPLINIGKGDVEYVVDVESDPEGYITSSSGGVIGGQSYGYAVFELAGPEPADEIEANAVINYDTGDSEGNMVVSITGSIVPLPDFTPIVKKGDFTFNTSIEYPFRMVEFNNVPAAMSGVEGEKGISDLYVYFNVPEGHKGTFRYQPRL